MFKLCPIEPNDRMMDAWDENKTYGMRASVEIKSNYKAMTAECQTVEIVEDVDLLAVQFLQKTTYYCNRQTRSIVIDMVKAYQRDLTQNGYKIIKVKDDE